MLEGKLRYHRRSSGSPRYEALVDEAVQAIAAALRSDRTVVHYIDSLLRLDGQDCGVAPPTTGASVERLLSFLLDFRLLRCAVVGSTRADDELWSAHVRTFFLHPQVCYTVAELALLWRVSIENVLDMFATETALWRQRDDGLSPAQMSVPWQDAVHATILFNTISAHDIERALGNQFDVVRPEDWRTVPVCLYLPRCLIERVYNEPMLPRNADLARRIENILLLHVEASTRFL